MLSRSVRDLAGVLDTIGTLSAAERWHAPAPSRPYAEEITRPPDRLGIGLLLSDVMTGIPTDDACVDAVRRTGALLADLGHYVDESHPPPLDGLLLRVAGSVATWGAVARDAQLRWLARIAGREIDAGDLDEEQFTATEAASRVSGTQVLDAYEDIDREMRAVHDWFEGRDILVTPVLRQPAWPLGQRGGAGDAGVFPATFSFTGQPAGVVPIDWTAAGLPVGVQIVGAYGRDDVVLRLMAQVEQARPWANRWPAVAVEA
jgi:amidase